MFYLVNAPVLVTDKSNNLLDEVPKVLLAIAGDIYAQRKASSDWQLAELKVESRLVFERLEDARQYAKKNATHGKVLPVFAVEGNFDNLPTDSEKKPIFSSLNYKLLWASLAHVDENFEKNIPIDDIVLSDSDVATINRANLGKIELLNEQLTKKEIDAILQRESTLKAIDSQEAPKLNFLKTTFVGFVSFLSCILIARYGEMLVAGSHAIAAYIPFAGIAGVGLFAWNYLRPQAPKISDIHVKYHAAPAKIHELQETLLQESPAICARLFTTLNDLFQHKTQKGDVEKAEPSATEMLAVFWEEKKLKRLISKTVEERPGYADKIINKAEKEISKSGPSHS